MRRERPRREAASVYEVIKKGPLPPYLGAEIEGDYRGQRHDESAMRLLRSNGADHIRLGVGGHFDTMFERFFVSTTGYDDEGRGSQWDEDPEGESVLDVLERVAG